MVTHARAVLRVVAVAFAASIPFVAASPAHALTYEFCDRWVDDNDYCWSYNNGARHSFQNFFGWDKGNRWNGTCVTLFKIRAFNTDSSGNSTTQKYGPQFCNDASYYTGNTQLLRAHIYPTNGWVGASYNMYGYAVT